jgi:hypothetical protein
MDKENGELLSHKKNEIMKTDGTGDHHVERNKPSSKKPNIAYCHSYVESRPKGMMVIILMGH